MTLPLTYDQVALVLQVALLGEVFPALRGVGFTIVNEEVKLVFCHDGPISEDELEATSVVQTEIIAGLPGLVSVRREVIRVDIPKRLPDLARWVYRRRE